MSSFTVSRKEVDDCPKMSDREKFVYIFTSLTLNPVVMGLSAKRRDEILMKLKEKFAPKVSNADWYVLFHDSDAKLVCANLCYGSIKLRYLKRDVRFEPVRHLSSYDTPLFIASF